MAEHRYDSGQKNFLKMTFEESVSTQMKFLNFLYNV